MLRVMRAGETLIDMTEEAESRICLAEPMLFRGVHSRLVLPSEASKKAVRHLEEQLCEIPRREYTPLGMLSNRMRCRSEPGASSESLRSPKLRSRMSKLGMRSKRMRRRSKSGMHSRGMRSAKPKLLCNKC